MKFILTILLAFSLTASKAQTQCDHAINSTFELYYFGYSDYIVGGYYISVYNFTESPLTILIEWPDGSQIVTVDGTEEVFNLPATHYEINGKIKATVITPKKCTLICQIKGSYY
jgi:hypothetical protein